MKKIAAPESKMIDQMKQIKPDICFPLLYGTPANSAESQQLETWPASNYGHLRHIKLLSGTFPDNNIFLMN